MAGVVCDVYVGRHGLSFFVEKRGRLKREDV
jgi:hypothetical protein